jgi:hypothetical protein
MHISRKPLLAGLLPVVAALALTILPAMASAAAPYWYVAGNKLAGMSPPPADNMKGYTVSGAGVGMNLTWSGLTVHTVCDETLTGKAWGDGHAQVTGATFTNCVVTAPTNCTLTLTADTSPPWTSQGSGTVATPATRTRCPASSST